MRHLYEYSIIHFTFHWNKRWIETSFDTSQQRYWRQLFVEVLFSDHWKGDFMSICGSWNQHVVCFIHPNGFEYRRCTWKKKKKKNCNGTSLMITFVVVMRDVVRSCKLSTRSYLFTVITMFDLSFFLVKLLLGKFEWLWWSRKGHLLFKGFVSVEHKREKERKKTKLLAIRIRTISCSSSSSSFDHAFVFVIHLIDVYMSFDLFFT